MNCKSVTFSFFQWYRVASPPPRADPLRLLRRGSGIPASSQAASRCDRAEMHKRTYSRMYHRHILFTTFVSSRGSVHIAMNSRFAFQLPSTFSAPVAAPAMLLHPVAVELQTISSVADHCPDSQISYEIDLFSARHSHDEQSPLPAARCVPMPNPAAAVSACTVDDSAVCTQLAPLHASCSMAALSPPLAPDPGFQPFSTFSASVAVPASSRCSPLPDHLLPFITASLPEAHQPSVTRPATGRALNQPHRLSSCDHAAATQLCENARRWSFAPPALSSVSYAALGHAAAAPVSTKGECQCSGAVCADDALSLSSSCSTASCVDSQVQRQHGGGTMPLQHRIRKRKNVQRVFRNALMRPLLHPQLQPLPREHEDGAPRPFSSSRCFRTDAVVVAVLLCLSCVFNVVAAQFEACPGAWSTAALSVARFSLAATSLPIEHLVIFAGGRTGL